MATNPQYPEQRGPQEVRKPQDIHPKLQVPKREQFPWPLIAIVIAIVILIALIAWLPRTPRRALPSSAAQVPTQPTADQIQLTNLNMQPAPVGDAFYLDGNLHNNGATEITGVPARASFNGINGQTLETETRPVEGLSQSGNVENLTADPIKPDQTRGFRIAFEHYPSGWDKRMPELTVTTVTATKP